MSLAVRKRVGIVFRFLWLFLFLSRKFCRFMPRERRISIGDESARDRLSSCETDKTTGRAFLFIFSQDGLVQSRPHGSVPSRQHMTPLFPFLHGTSHPVPSNLVKILSRSVFTCFPCEGLFQSKSYSSELFSLFPHGFCLFNFSTNRPRRLFLPSSDQSLSLSPSRLLFLMSYLCWFYQYRRYPTGDRQSTEASVRQPGLQRKRKQVVGGGTDQGVRQPACVGVAVHDGQP